MLKGYQIHKLHPLCASIIPSVVIRASDHQNKPQQERTPFHYRVAIVSTQANALDIGTSTVGIYEFYPHLHHHH